MNILILTTHLNPGGISRYVINLAKGLTAKENKVWIGCSRGEWVNQLENIGINYKFILIKTKSIISIKIFLSFLSLRKFILQERIDIIHSNTRVTQFLGFLIYKFLKIPYLSTFHGFYRPGIFRKLFKFRGCKTIAISKAVKNHLIKDLKIDDERVKVVYNGIDISEFSALRTVKKEDYDFNKADYLIGILGRISAEKGHFLAVEAISKLHTKYKNISLLISGQGKLQTRLKTYIKNKGLGKKIRFLNCEAPQFLDLINLLIVPSKKEGFGYSIIEGFVKRVPVIGHNVGGIAELIKDKENGLLFYDYTGLSLAEKIEEIMQDEDLRKKLVNQAQKDALFYSHLRMAEDTEKIYKEILEG